VSLASSVNLPSSSLPVYEMPQVHKSHTSNSHLHITSLFMLRFNLSVRSFDLYKSTTASTSVPTYFPKCSKVNKSSQLPFVSWNEPTRFCFKLFPPLDFCCNAQVNPCFLDSCHFTCLPYGKGAIVVDYVMITQYLLPFVRNLLVYSNLLLTMPFFPSPSGPTPLSPYPTTMPFFSLCSSISCRLAFFLIELCWLLASNF
jgi:hypothetical protein